MQSSIKQLALATTLALAAGSALAAVPGPAPNPTSGDGALLVAVWDNDESVVQWVNRTGSATGDSYLDVEFSDLTTSGSAGINLAYDPISLSIFENLNEVQYAVFSADTFGVSGAGFGYVSTVNGDPTQGGSLDLNALSPLYAGAAGVIGDYVSIHMNGLSCSGANPCVAAPGGSAYWGNFAGSDFATQQFFAPNSASLGTAMDMWSFQSIDPNTGEAQTQRYAIGDRVGEWLLTSTGALTYTFPGDGGTPVPLPAAAWLMMSGLAGLGAVGRRKRAAA